MQIPDDILEIILRQMPPHMAYRGPLAPERPMELVGGGARRLTGYDPQQFIAPAQVPYGRLIHPDDQAQVWAELQTAVSQKRPFELLYRIRTAGNELKWALERGCGLFDRNGRLLGVEGLISDMTEQILTQQLLEQRVIDRTRKLSALYEVMAVAAAQNDLKSSLRQALSWVIKAVHGRSGIVQLLDSKDDQLHLAAYEGMSDDLAAQLDELSPQNGLWSEVVQGERPYTTLNSQTDPHTPPGLRQTNLRAYAGLPIVAHERLIGVLNIWRDIERNFSQSDIALMAAVAGQIGATIETARLRRENERLLLLDERNRLARELHDAVTQSLYSLTLFAAANERYAQAGDLENVAQYSARINETAARSLKEMRLLLHNLRPSILQETGLGGALQHRLDAVEKRAGIHTRLLCDSQIALPPHVEETLYHIAEEALNNALKHAGATAVRVSVSQQQNHITLTVSDNGCGFDAAHLPDEGGLGLSSMQERVDMLGGDLAIQSGPEGTTVTVECNLDTLMEATASQNLLDLVQE
ncbi:MAG TPA: GAF domain-containing protein [Anaerolineae bacterium]|nr:GAF domain-containing protein [Anaerolineae bacterium]